MVPITIVNGVYKPSYNWGAHIVQVVLFQVSECHIYSDKARKRALPKIVVVGTTATV